MGSFKAESELFRVPFKWLPDKFQFGNFINMFSSIPFFKYLKNTMIIVVCNIVGSLLSCSLVAYGFARLRWPGRDKVFILVLITMILPYQVTLVPLFLMFTKMKWWGTFLPLTVTCFFGNPFFIFLLRQFFTGIPQDISEAARIDGAGEFTIFSKLVIPMAKPALTTVAIFAFIRSWNDFLGPLVFLGKDELYTLSLAASMLKSESGPQLESAAGTGRCDDTSCTHSFLCDAEVFYPGYRNVGDQRLRRRNNEENEYEKKRSHSWSAVRLSVDHRFSGVYLVPDLLLPVLFPV